MPIRQLEERVFAHGDPADTSVLGDALASAGDLRGELIALEAAAGHPLWVGKPIPRYLEDVSDERGEPWREAVLAWAGPQVARAIDDGWLELRFHRGFADARVRYRADACAALLESPAGRVLRSLELEGHIGPESLRELLAGVQREQPWLERLLLASWRNEGSQIDLRPLAELLPRLAELSLYGHRVVSHLPPPGPRTLRLAGAHALALAEPLPGVACLDLAIHPALQEPPLDAAVAIASRRWFPHLARLDLSRNEPGAREPESLGWRGAGGSIFTHLSALDVLPDLAELRLPEVRTEADATAVRAALSRLPPASRLVLTREYDCLTDEPSPRAAALAADPRVALPVRYPFPLPSTIGKDALSIDDHTVGIDGLAEYLALVWGELGEAARRAWYALFELVSDLPYDDADGRAVIVRAPREALLAALASCALIAKRRYRDLKRTRPIYDHPSDTERLWLELLRALEAAPANETCTVQRQWGLS